MDDLVLQYPTIIKTRNIGHVKKGTITDKIKDVYPSLELTVNGCIVRVLMPDEYVQETMYKAVRKVIMRRLDKK